MHQNKSISFVIPCFNEESRILELLSSIEKNYHLHKNNYILQYIVVNDGSSDRTLEIINKNKFIKNNNFTLVSYESNKGKGYAIVQGVKHVNHNWIITLDADLSISMDQAIKRFEKLSTQNSVVYFGSRNLKESNIKKKFHRYILGKIFNFLIKLILKINIKDTQCGFKIYYKPLAFKIFPKIRDYSFSHDLEIILICQKLNIKVQEIPVDWVHKNGSKVKLISDSIKMLKNIFKLKKKYLKS